MSAVDKGPFPTILKKLWGLISPDNLVAGFRGSGLWPFNSSSINLGRCLNHEDDITTPDDIGSPR